VTHMFFVAVLPCWTQPFPLCRNGESAHTVSYKSDGAEQVPERGVGGNR